MESVHLVAEILDEPPDIETVMRIMNSAEADAKIIVAEQASGKSSAMEKLVEVWINFVLSPTTHVNNAVSGAIATLMQPVERLTAAGFSKIFQSENAIYASEAAANEGRTGQSFMDRYNAIIADPPKRLQEQADALGNYVAMTKELGKTGSAMEEVFIEWPILKLFGAAFFRSGTNMVKFTGERTPLAILSSSIRADIRAGGARRDMALARMATGSLLLATASSLALAGKLTGGGSSLENQKLGLAVRARDSNPTRSSKQTHRERKPTCHINPLNHLPHSWGWRRTTRKSSTR